LTIKSGPKERKRNSLVNKDGWLSLGEVAKMLGVHPSTVRNWSDQGDLPVHRTRGGHRRYRQSDVELWIQSHDAKLPADVYQVEQTALRRTRLQISEGQLESEVWYQKLDAEAREQYRRSGRATVQALMAYLGAAGKEAESEARALGFDYASQARRCALTTIEAIKAFLYFRDLVMDSVLAVYTSASVSSPQVWSDMMRKMTAFTDIVMLTLLETMEAYERGAREREK
jgi:excisionase family DNA binding protein